MKIGVIQAMPWPLGSSFGEVYTDSVNRAVRADELGFYSCWLVEHHFAVRGGDLPGFCVNPDPLTFLAHLAAKTNDIRLGTGVIVLPYDNPLRVAERAAMVDILSDGRLELGVGRGGAGIEMRGFSVDPNVVRDGFPEAVQLIQRAFVDENLSFNGDYYSADGLWVVPRPVQPGGPPMYVAAVSPQSFENVGSEGWQYCHIPAGFAPTPFANFGEQRNWYLQAAETAGKEVDGSDLPHVLQMYCAPTTESARNVAAEHFDKLLRYSETQYERSAGYPKMLGRWQENAERFPQYYGGLEAPAAPPSGPEERRVVAEQMTGANLVGTPEEILVQLEELHGFGIEYVLAGTDWGGLSCEDSLASMELFAREVLPFVPGGRGDRGAPK